MKDHFKIIHSTKFAVVLLNNKQVMDLEIRFQIHTNVSNFEMASPKTIWTLKIFLISVIYLKIDENRNFQLRLSKW